MVYPPLAQRNNIAYCLSRPCWILFKSFLFGQGERDIRAQNIKSHPDPVIIFLAHLSTKFSKGQFCDPYLSRDMWFPAMWYFDKCRLRQAYAAHF